jgi:hypothetical protein
MVREKRARRHAKGSIWDTPRIQKMLAEPVGAPIELTREEALAIVRGHLESGASYDAAGSERRLRELRKIRRESGALLVRPDKDA